MLSQVLEKVTKFGNEKNLKRLFRNALIALSGNMGAAIINLVTMSLTARFLGASDFGVLVLITTFIFLIDSVVNFQSWQAIIKHASHLIKNKTYDKLANLLVFGFKIDFLTAILGFILANLIIYVIANIYKDYQAYSYLAHIYSFSILFNIKGTPIAILRGFDRFAKFANQQIVLSIVKLCLVSIGVLFFCDLETVVIMWLVAEVIGRVLLVIYATQELNRREVHLDWSYSIQAAKSDFLGIWRFLISSNLNSSLRLGSREVDVFIIGIVLSTADVGIYKVAKQFAGIVGKVVDPLYQAVYPELVELVNKANSRVLKKFLFKVTSISIAISIVIWGGAFIITPFVINYSVGAEFSEAYIVVLIYMFAVIISSSGFTLQPMMLAFGKPDLSLKINMISTIIYIVTLFILTGYAGLLGAASSYIVYYVFWTGIMYLYVNREIIGMSQRC